MCSVLDSFSPPPSATPSGSLLCWDSDQYTSNARHRSQFATAAVAAAAVAADGVASVADVALALAEGKGGGGKSFPNVSERSDDDET